MRTMWTIAALVALAGCDSGPSSEELAEKDARDVAMVEAANEVMPPLTLVTPEPILLPDIERYDLYGMACNYAPGTSFGTRVVSRESDAFVKIDGEVHRLAADPGSRELPMRTRTLYNGKEYSLRLAIDGEHKIAADGTSSFEGSVTLRDAYGRVVYEGTGLAQCKA
jgi:hypothetical protein